MFKLLLFAMLRGDRISTHIMEYLYNTPFFKALSGKGDHQTRHSSIADRLSSMPPEYFQQIFQWVLERYAKVLGTNKLFKKIKRFDSTMVPISSALVDWGMRVGRPPDEGYQKVQLKLTMEMHANLPASVKSFFDQGHLSEEIALKEAILSNDLSQGDIAVFDRGLKSRYSLQVFDFEGISFVTRGAPNTKYEVLEVHRKIQGRKADGLRFLQDVKVHLYTDGGEVMEHPFRLIEAEILETGERIIFLTNIWDLNAMQIARIYHYRWDIEVFFRFLKQELGIKHLINRSENGVQIQIYAALIAAILLLVFKISNNIPGYHIAKMAFMDDLLILLFNELNCPP
jgi:hypothetical protein